MTRAFDHRFAKHDLGIDLNSFVLHWSPLVSLHRTEQICSLQHDSQPVHPDSTTTSARFRMRHAFEAAPMRRKRSPRAKPLRGRARVRGLGERASARASLSPHAPCGRPPSRAVIVLRMALAFLTATLPTRSYRGNPLPGIGASGVASAPSTLHWLPCPQAHRTDFHRRYLIVADQTMQDWPYGLGPPSAASVRFQLTAL